MPSNPAMPETQAQLLQSKLPPPKAPDGSSPQVVIPSALELTLEQEQRLLRHCKDRFQQLNDELGRADYEAPAYTSTPNTTLRQNLAKHLAKRHLSHLIFQQRMEWRSYVLGGIYAETNLHLPLTTRIVSQQIARANKSFFGTDPWFAVSGLQADSDLLAEDVNAYAHHQLVTLGRIQASLENAVELAFIQGECAVKTRRHKLTSYFESWRNVAVDPSGQPYTANDGDYIYDTDLFVSSQVPVIDPATGLPAQDPETGAPMMQEGPDLVLKRDMKTPQPPAMQFQSLKLDQAKLLEDRVEARPIYYLDFLCPLNAPDVQSADIIVHCYNAKVIELADRYLRDTWGEGVDISEQINRVADLVHRVNVGSTEARQAIGDRDRPEQGETTRWNTGRDRNEPIVGLAECWLWYDVKGDGVLRNIMVLMDQEGRIPIYYDYAANLTDDGLRPIDIVRINPVTGRWHGQGNVERFYNLQDQADLLINRALFAESRAARVDFWNPSATIEGTSNPNLEMNWGGSYRLANGKKAEDALASVYLTNIKGQSLKDLLQTVMQVMQAMSAVSNVNDGAMVGLDTAKLATGIKNLEASGEELFHQLISHLRPCLEDILRRALKVLLTTIAQPDGKQALYSFFDRPNKRLVEIDPHRLRDLDLQIELDLTTYKAQSQLQQSQLAFTMMQAYLAAIMAPPEIIEQRLGPLVQQQLKALQIRDAENMTKPIPRPALLPPTNPSASPANVTAGPPEPTI